MVVKLAWELFAQEPAVLDKVESKSPPLPLVDSVLGHEEEGRCP